LKKFIFTTAELPDSAIHTLTTLSNGFISIRGVPELTETSTGTFIAGVYCDTPLFYRELVNLPRVVSLYVRLDGVPLVPSEEVFTLDALRGIVEYKAKLVARGGYLEYTGVRLVHAKRKEVVALRGKLVSRGVRGRLTLDLPVELNTCNPSVPENICVKLYRVVEKSADSQAVRVKVVSADQRYSVEFAAGAKSSRAALQAYAAGERVGFAGEVEVEDGSVVTVEKLVAASTAGEAASVLNAALNMDFNQLAASHSEEWERRWRELGLEAEGDEEFVDALYLNTFHLLQMYNSELPFFALPARGFHGHGYRGHVFWDTEIYALPFYLILKPEASRKILMYRCALLNAARYNAERNGCRGAQFPWESADDGFEATPREIPLDLRGERKVVIRTGELEHHITADVAYAVWLYHRYTGDDEFISQCGLALLIETARFWASRFEYDSSKGKYVIRRVIGPDEYHVGVDNSFYTNLLAAFNLQLAASYSRQAGDQPEGREVLSQLNVTDSEVREWERIAENVFLPRGADGVWEEFEGYLSLEDYTLPEGCIGEACVPEDVLARVEKTRLVKQADVVAGLFLLRHLFSREELSRNYEFYKRRTTHASSLSIPMYAGLAAYIGKLEEASALLRTAMLADLKNIYANTGDGFHVGSAGGAWTALLFGFLRLEENRGKLTVAPVLPPYLRRLRLTVNFRGKRYLLEVDGKRASIKELS